MEAEKIIVAVSGGVDSAVVALQMKNLGYNVVAVMLKLYSGNSCSNRQCCGNDDIVDVQRFCGKFDIPYYIINQEELFYNEVMVDFADSYISGKTPVPCMNCNKKVKINTMIKVARAIGAKYVATGHYVKSSIENGIHKIYRANDITKDQSYFLSTLTQDELNMLRFPIGHLIKGEVRRIAEEFGIEIAYKKDSQDICFVGSDKYIDVIKKINTNVQIDRSGEILDYKSNQVLGYHNGAINYTIGQRRGLGVASARPLYVVKIDIKKNIVYISDECDLFSNKLEVHNANFFADMVFTFKNNSILIAAAVCLRALQGLIACSILIIFDENVNFSSNLSTLGYYLDNYQHRIVIELEESGRAITPGQYCVFYQKERLIGSAEIK